MRAVLMAGGSGTRLRPLTCDLPKPMVPILNRPIAEHIINLLKQHQIHEVIATLHYLPDTMPDYFHDGSQFGVRLNYAVEEKQPLGTAGCVKNIEEMLDDTFIVISGDCVTDFDLSAAIAFHRECNSAATLILKRVPNPLEFGVVILDDDQRIIRFLEKPSTSEIFSDTVNTGIYILEPTVLGFLPKEQECDFSKDLFPLLLDKHVPMYGYVAEGYWCDVGNLEAYRNAQYDALYGKVAVAFPCGERSPGIWVGQNTQVDPSAKLHPPVVIGNNCRIGAGAVLEAGTILGDNVTVGSSADLKRPIVWNGVTIGAETHLRACTIARGSRIDRRSHIMEGAVVGALSVVGEEAQISPTVRIWPSKQVESGAILNMNLIWGQVAQRALFDQRGVAGLANIDITPEFAVKLGTAYGSTLDPGDHVSVSRDQRSVSRMVARAFISGLMSVGVDVYNLEAAAIPVARTAVPTLEVSGGVHVRVHPTRPDSILVEFFDHQGINI
ncbi:MAG: sugar phosphate nucleotidyltransferase, partial [Cyanobacteria bacterium P01_H01_bin.130]